MALYATDFERLRHGGSRSVIFRVVHEWRYADEQLAYLAPANDDRFMIELLGGGAFPPAYKDLGDSLRYAGRHHFDISVADIRRWWPIRAGAALRS